ncbi:type II toxin-antitoxin system RelE/ParE family toxin [Candidatus Poribacteria bacterium]|nr:type II toxin-antitoxin system RelE/ParE family toxin [Candidatus Poribacteria bacterium]MYA58058.1 type II toxin-antitoxin system RelE/ParE family toxin [Candidatus Poribacteria bacterium]
MHTSRLRNIQVYRALNGKEPFNEWLKSIQDRKTRARIRAGLERLRLGNFGNVKFLGEGVLELRFHFGRGYRIYFGEIRNTIVLLLCAGDKSSQTRDIERAKSYWLKYKEENL